MLIFAYKYSILIVRLNIKDYKIVYEIGSLLYLLRDENQEKANNVISIIENNINTPKTNKPTSFLMT